MVNNQTPVSAAVRLLRWLMACCVLLFGVGICGGVMAQSMPGKNIQVQALQNTIAEETFQTLIVMKALRALGYEVKDSKEIEPPIAHITIAQGDATFMAMHWDILHESFYQNAGGDAKLSRAGRYSPGGTQGYLIDKKTADAYKITHVDQLKDPKIAQLFDINGDGKADLIGCNPGWGCELAIEHHLDAYKLRDTVTHVQGSYSALIADVIARFKQGRPVLYYTWAPYWVSGVLIPGKDVLWLQVPFSATPEAPKNVGNGGANGFDTGFPVNTQRIVANRAFLEKNPAAARLFEIMQLPVADINAQNLLMRNGQNKFKDIERHADAWIKGHPKTFNRWLSQARAAADN